MSPSRQLTYLGLLIAALVVIVKSAQIAFEPHLYAATVTLVRAIFSNVVVQAVLVTAGFVALISLCAAAWDRSDRRYQEHQARLAEAARWEAARRDTSSLMDDSPGALPEKWQAPCGEPIRRTHDRDAA